MIILKRLILFIMACQLSACTAVSKSSFGYGYIPQQGSDPHGQGIIVNMPINAPSISQRYKPEESDQMIHHGIDIIGDKTSAIIAAADGKVIRSNMTIWGNIVVIDHGTNNTGMITRTEYAHLSKRLVETGEIVKRGQSIGKMGRTGLLSGGFIHLHFSVTQHKPGSVPGPDSGINPHLLWFNGPGQVSCYQNQAIPDKPLKFTYPVTCASQTSTSAQP